MYKILLSVFLIALVACKQKPPGSNKINTNIRNSKTDKHINIPGTRLYIIPPPGFTVSQTPAGLKKGNNILISIMDLADGNFYNNAATFTKGGFEQKGAKVSDYQDIKVNGYPAKFAAMEGGAGNKMDILVFGDSSFSTVIMGVYPTLDSSVEKQIIASLNTIYYDKNKKVDPFEAANFSLDDQHSDFKFFQYNINSYVYTKGGVDNKTDADAPFFTITQMPVEKGSTVKFIGESIVNRMQQYGLAQVELKNETEEKVNGYDAYQAEIHGSMKGKPCAIYQCIVTKGDKAFSIQGIAKSDFDQNITAFKNLAHTIKIK
jgi:hypothetical protein